MVVLVAAVALGPVARAVDPIVVVAAAALGPVAMVPIVALGPLVVAAAALGAVL